MIIPASNALIAWNDVENGGIREGKAPPGSVAIGPLLSEEEPDWTYGVYALS